MFIGFNIGSISVKVVKINDQGRIVQQLARSHMGDPQKTISSLLEENPSYYGVSGHFGHYSESQAIERALQCEDNYDIVVSLGGEAFMIYLLRNNRIMNVLSFNRCAAGSGEFLVQQVGRLNLSLEEAIEIAKRGKSIKLASRCSVHCKSDITHKLNRREETIEDILYSVHESMASKIISLINKSNHPRNRILIIGGLSQNSLLRDIIATKLAESAVIISDRSLYLEAWGTALLTMDDPKFLAPEISIDPKYGIYNPLIDARSLVTIHEDEVQPTKQVYGPLVMGIDGGSTTTKIAVVDIIDNRIVASHYTRTNGNPVLATKECVLAVIDQIGDKQLELVATTGSAREIIAAYITTSAVYNEISAHAKGATAFDPDVDTIFEIGGQDSKYIYINKGVPIDYAMNAACSAGTGSFLEESAQGDLGISVYDISDIALEADSPVRFQAECAAFINSDIRGALQEGYSRESIIGGLVYSIVNNYLTKVKGSRKVGKKIFLQGGIAKNSAIAYAFAQVTQKEIVVPSNPELMGAYGTALMAYEKYELGILQHEPKTVSDLIKSELETLGNFVCRSCDNYCEINRYQVGDRKFPFGGRCSKYESQWKGGKTVQEVEDYVARRNDIIHSVVDKHNNDKPTVGIPKALTTHSLLPLYYTFFRELGFNVVVSGIDYDGELYLNAPYCFPTQVAHGAILDLRKQENIDYVFFPQLQRMPYRESEYNSFLCPITQANPFILKKAFNDVRFLSPTLNFQLGYRDCKSMTNIIVDEFGFPRDFVTQAYNLAVQSQINKEQEMQLLGKEALNHAISTNSPAIVLVGRSYNAFPNETSQSIGRKLASKGVVTIPFDCLGSQNSDITPWYFPNLILQAVDLTKRYENIFLLYISNFGCNVDNFTLEYLRGAIGDKPYLKLDIDSHTADAGTLTRIEAFLEIIQNYMLKKENNTKQQHFKMCELIRLNGKYVVSTSSGETLDMKDKRIKYHFPIFSRFHNDIFPRVFSWAGYQTAKPLRLSKVQLERGLRYTSGNECLPMPIYIGQLLQILDEREEGEITGVYMIAGGEPCVVASYVDVLNKFIEDHQIPDLFIFDPHVEKNNLYDISPFDMFRHFPIGFMLGDIATEIYNTLVVVSDQNGVAQFEHSWQELIANSENRENFDRNISGFIKSVGKIPLLKDPRNMARVLISGDFFVRFDPFFFDGLIEKYAAHDIILKPVDLSELLLYGPHDNMMLYSKNFSRPFNAKLELAKSVLMCGNADRRKFIQNWGTAKLFERTERKWRERFEVTGLLTSSSNKLNRVIDYASEHIDPTITGETILTVGKAIEAMSEDYDGVMILGPFACLPFRISEGILKPLFLEEDYPFLSYETDGRAVPPVFLRLVDIHIQHVLRKRSSHQMIPLSGMMR